MPDSLPLTVTIPAHEWETAKRRVRFLEAALTQTLRERQQLREWFTASSLANMRLAGLPTSRHGVMLKANREEWPRRIALGPGGEQIEFHFSALPRSAFDDVIRRVYALPAASNGKAEPLPPPDETLRAASAATPQWLLPLMRVVRARPDCDATAIMRELDTALPVGALRPTLQDVARVMNRRI